MSYTFIQKMFHFRDIKDEIKRRISKTDRQALSIHRPDRAFIIDDDDPTVNFNTFNPNRHAQGDDNPIFLNETNGNVSKLTVDKGKLQETGEQTTGNHGNNNGGKATLPSNARLVIANANTDEVVVDSGEMKALKNGDADVVVQDADTETPEVIPLNNQETDPTVPSESNSDNNVEAVQATELDSEPVPEYDPPTYSDPTAVNDENLPQETSPPTEDPDTSKK